MANTKITDGAASRLRFGIGEWFGEPLTAMSEADRGRFAAMALSDPGSAPPQCPFMSTPEKPRTCWKRGGVCSLRLYEDTGNGSGTPAEGPEGDLRAVCPWRFYENQQVFSLIAAELLQCSTPEVVREVRFLRRRDGAELSEISQVKKQEGVGNIDCVLVAPGSDPMRWCALEIQAVYFSGEKMSHLFEQIGRFKGPGVPFPDRVRRPDYRSSGPKRLMPQLQIKVPTLRRWGKKMAVVVDAAFYRNLGTIRTQPDISNADIAWFVAHFDLINESYRLRLDPARCATLEDAVEGLTGGEPVSLPEFEEKIAEKLRCG